MANTTLNMQLLLRRDEVFTSTYVLAEGEPGFEVSTNTLKIGDGTKTWVELPIANKAQIDALIKVVDDKVTALNDTFATDAEVKAIKEDLESAINDKVDQSDYNTYTSERLLTDETINGAINNVDAKFVSYRTAADQDAIDATLATKEALEAVTDELATYGDIVTHNVADFATAAQGAKADAAAVKTEVDAALLLKADKSVVDAMYTNTQIDQLVQGAKDYADSNDANTEYHVEYDSTNKKIKLVAGADASKMEIDATDFIKDGMIDTVTIGDDNDLVITFNTAAGKENIIVPLDQLVDIYTGKAGDRVTVTVASDKSISAELVAGSISKNYLDSNVQDSLGKADSALQAADLSDYAKTADVVTNDEFTRFETTNTAAINAKLDANTFNEFNNGTSKTVAAIEADIVAKANAAQSAAEAKAAELDTALHSTISGEIATAKQEAINAAKERLDTIDEALTVVKMDDGEGGSFLESASLSAGSGTLSLSGTNVSINGEVNVSGGIFTFNNKAIATQEYVDTKVAEVQEAVDAIDVGVTKVVAGEDIVVTPAEGTGVVTIAHETFTTGEYTKDPATSDKTNDVYMMTGVTVDNGHVTGANVKSLAHALEALTFVLDGGTSAN